MAVVTNNNSLADDFLVSRRSVRYVRLFARAGDRLGLFAVVVRGLRRSGAALARPGAPSAGGFEQRSSSPSYAAPFAVDGDRRRAGRASSATRSGSTSTSASGRDRRDRAVVGDGVRRRLRDSGVRRRVDLGENRESDGQHRRRERSRADSAGLRAHLRHAARHGVGLSLWSFEVYGDPTP